MLSDINNRQYTLRLKRYHNAIIIGVGGIGSWVALDIALTGCVTNIILYDNDIIEESNLNRTPFKLKNIGENKVYAVKELIHERRLCNVYCYDERFDEKSIENLTIDGINIMKSNTVIIDCRDDIYKDYNIDCKKWKLGYDGLSITIDGNPEETVVMGQSSGYTITPSFVCPSQLIANIVVNNIFVNSKSIFSVVNDSNDNIKDNDGLFNKILTIDTSDLLSDLYMLEKGKTNATKAFNEDSPENISIKRIN